MISRKENWKRVKEDLLKVFFGAIKTHKVQGIPKLCPLVGNPLHGSPQRTATLFGLGLPGKI